MPFPKGGIPWNRGKKITEETRARLSMSHRGKSQSLETRKKMSDSRTGRPRSEETKEKIRMALTGKKRPDSVVKKMSESAKGKPAWNKGVPCRAETMEKLSRINTGKRHSEKTIALMKTLKPSAETRMKISLSAKGRFRSEETIRKMLRRNAMSRLEIKFQEIVKKNGLPYRFVGDGSFFVGRKNPDFINSNGEKIAVEVYARYYKLRHAGTIEEWKRERKEIFGDHGWTVIFFDETQVNENNIIEKLKAA
ncbi:MAG: NUMOD3 domain-containing DNA-binding protein [Candidatus Omnitrophica bacterium]|nr:NUMOD3 domain-containing DNA-binding protein [Candidatus Omnitrophota bacterium]